MHYLFQFLIFFLLSLSSTEVKSYEEWKTILVNENEDLKISLTYQSVTDISQTKWLQVLIENKTNTPIIILDARYSIDTKEVSITGEQILCYRTYGGGNIYNLFHHFYDKPNPSNQKYKLFVKAKQTIKTWKHLTDYASLILYERQSEGTTDICSFYNSMLKYKKGKKLGLLENSQAEFCFKWVPHQNITIQAISDRLQTAMADTTCYSAKSYLIGYLINNKKVVSEVESQAFIEAILSRRSSKHTYENIRFLRELAIREALPNPDLTDHFKTILKEEKQRGSFDELFYYWDITLLDDLLNSSIFAFQFVKIIRKHQLLSMKDTLVNAKVYNYLAEAYTFNPNIYPQQESFQDWVYQVKHVAVSGDQRVIDYLIPLLSDKSAFLFKDTYRYPPTGVRIKNLKPDITMLKVCDVAAVALMIAANQSDQLNQLLEEVKQTDYSSTKSGLTGTRLLGYKNDATLSGYEKYISYDKHLKDIIQKIYLD